MHPATSPTKVRSFESAKRWLTNAGLATLWLVACATLSVHAQTPRQTGELQIVNRGKADLIVAPAQPPRPMRPLEIAKLEQASAGAIQAPLPRPLEQPPVAKQGQTGMVGVPARPAGPTQSNKMKTPPVFLAYDQTDNTFKMAKDLPVDLRRVAVLPLAWEGSSTDLSSGGETLGPIWLSELIKTKKFEAVSVSPQGLRSLTGRLSWTGAETLPADFFDSLQRVYGCNAVLFCQLTTFRAYAPLAIGWRMKLVDAQTGRIIWAVDKVFDAEERTELNRASQYHMAWPWGPHDPSIDWQVKNSPRQFGQYTIVQALSTLPNRKEMTKVSLPATDVPSRRQTE